VSSDGARSEEKCRCRLALHNGKASHDALSTGYLKLPRKITGQRQCRVDVTGMLNTYPRCVLEG
jgi:hypothetical protein